MTVFDDLRAGVARGGYGDLFDAIDALEDIVTAARPFARGGFGPDGATFAESLRAAIVQFDKAASDAPV